MCATPELAKCRKFFTREEDGLRQDWGKHICWMNPPYSRQSDGNLEQWVKKAFEAAKQGAVVVALLPVFTNAVWFHKYASHATIELLKGRLQFGNREHNGPYAVWPHDLRVSREIRKAGCTVDHQPRWTSDRHIVTEE